MKVCIPNNKRKMFIDILFPKTKPILVDIIYKPLSQIQFLEQIVREFEVFDLNHEI